MKRKASAVVLVVVAALGLGACNTTETYFADTCPPGYVLHGMQCVPAHVGYWQGHYYPSTPMRPTRVERTRTVTKTTVRERRSLFGGARTTVRSYTRTYGRR